MSRSSRLTPSGAAAAGLYVVVTFMSLLQQPGNTTYDTRAELTQRPWDFLGEAFTLWHPESNFGEFQNQAYGYLFPQGTWFVLTDWLGVADWVSQRLWSALVLIVAIEGARRVARVIGLDGAAALLAGVAFGFAPRMLGTVPVLTGESLPGAVMPWLVLPILLVFRGALTPRRGAVLSGAAVVCMGGVNAVEVAGSLPLAVILVVWGVRRGLATRRFAAWWAGAVALASVWWVLPLLVLARYSPPFYQYVESAANTTSIIGWSEAARGDSHWVAYLIAGDQAWWPAANALASEPMLILVAAAVSAIGFYGLARLEHPVRGPLVLSAAVGLGAITIAHGGWAGSPLADVSLRLLDGPLQIFRNVHKIDPVIRLPLAIGFGHAVAMAWRALAARWPGVVPARPLVLLLPLALVLTLGQPYLVNHARTPGWDQISDPWLQAQEFLAEHDDGRATLVLPGSGFAQHPWGWTLDEPLQVLGGVDRVTRSQVPLIPGQSIRFLGALDQLATTGRATPLLADHLARAGIGHVVIRRDLDRFVTGSPHPGGSAVSVANAGLTSVASFGDSGEGGPDVEVLDLDQKLPELRTTPVDDVLTVLGAPEGILGVTDAGLVDPDRATVLQGEPGWDRTTQVVTDSDQRRERAFGLSDEAVSAVLGDEEDWRTARSAHNYPNVPDARQVVARYDGLRSLTASSAQGYADNFGPIVPQGAPYAAVDGDVTTRWLTSPATDPREQWLRLEFDEPRPVRRVEVVPVVNDTAIIPVRTLEVRAGDQRVDLVVAPSGARNVALFDGRPVSSVEVRVTGAAVQGNRGSIGLRDVQVDDLEPTRSLVVPGELDADAAWVFATTPDRRACTITIGVPDCDVRRIRGAEERDGLDRTYTTTETTSVRLRGWVVARGTREAALLLEPFLSEQQVGASSVYGADPKVSSRFAYDGQPTTAWISADEDENPTLIFTWNEPRTITGMALRSGGALGSPSRAIVRSGKRAQEVALVGDSAVSFPRPVTTRRLEVQMIRPLGVAHVVVPEITLTGVDVTRPLVADLPTGARCGLGPNVIVDGEVVPTRVRGTLADVINGTPLRLQGCSGDGSAFILGPGEHRVTAPPTQEFAVTQLAGVPDARLDPTATTASREVDVVRWDASHRVADVAAGPESLLYLPENFNDGWVATVGDEELEALRVDGWQQAWVLPASNEAAQVTLDYRPQRTYAILLPLGLGTSGLLLLAGLVIAIHEATRRRGRRVARVDPWPDLEPVPSRPVVVAAVLSVVALLLLGPVATAGLVSGLVASAGAVDRRGLRRVTTRWTVARAAVAAALLVVLSAVLDVAGGPSWVPSLADASAALGVGVVVGIAIGVVSRSRRVAS